VEEGKWARPRAGYLDLPVDHHATFHAAFGIVLRPSQQMAVVANRILLALLAVINVIKKGKEGRSGGGPGSAVGRKLKGTPFCCAAGRGDPGRQLAGGPLSPTRRASRSCLQRRFPMRGTPRAAHPPGFLPSRPYRGQSQSVCLRWRGHPCGSPSPARRPAAAPPAARATRGCRPLLSGCSNTLTLRMPNQHTSPDAKSHPDVILRMRTPDAIRTSGCFLTLPSQPLSTRMAEDIGPVAAAVAGEPKRVGYLPWHDYFMAVAFLSAKRSKDPQCAPGLWLCQALPAAHATDPAPQSACLCVCALFGVCVYVVWCGVCVCVCAAHRLAPAS
jgi:hypothetical protein